MHYNEGVDDDSAAAGERLRLTLEMFEVGENLMRERLRRENPLADDAEIEARLIAWLRERPGAEHGDAIGRPIAWPCRRR